MASTVMVEVPVWPEAYVEGKPVVVAGAQARRHQAGVAVADTIE